MNRTLRRAGCGALLFLAAGCYESSTPLGPPERGAVDRTLVGRWRCKEPAEGSTAVATLLVLPFDQRQYYLEWREDEDVSRWGAHSSQVRGETLFNVRELHPEPRRRPWIFYRARREPDGRLQLSIVKNNSLKNLGEGAALRDIGRRVNDEALYERWAECTVQGRESVPTAR